MGTMGKNGSYGRFRAADEKTLDLSLAEFHGILVFVPTDEGLNPNGAAVFVRPDLRANMKNRTWIRHAATATWAVFMVLCLFSIENSRLGTLRSKQSIQLSELGLTSIAPDNLPRAAEIFRTTLRAQDHEFPVENMTRLPAWSTLQSTLSAYAERLKLLDAQRDEIDRHLQQRTLWTSWAALAFMIANGIAFQMGWRTKDTKHHEEPNHAMH
jgi:hypothetical protein